MKVIMETMIYTKVKKPSGRVIHLWEQWDGENKVGSGVHTKGDHEWHLKISPDRILYKDVSEVREGWPVDQQLEIVAFKN